MATPTVRLLPSVFRSAQERCGEYLWSLDPDRLLSRFRSEAGLTPRAEAYGGWEQKSISGHSLGHYLSGCAKMFAGTGDGRFRGRAEYVVGELAECQRANGNGYVGAIPGARKAFDEVAAGDIRSQGFDLNGLWVPWYTLHKLFAGLRDAHGYAGVESAWGVLTALTDWACRTLEPLSDEQVQKMLDCEHGGMNEVLADVYAATRDPRHGRLAARFNHRRVLEPLARGVDELAGKHANTQVPKVIGAARQWEVMPGGVGGVGGVSGASGVGGLSGASGIGGVGEVGGGGGEGLRDASLFFWDTVVRHHSYACGGNSLDEHFGPAGVIAGRLFGNNTCETCNTYNMLKLTRVLDRRLGRAGLYDYYERALYNHILASQDPSGAGVVYFLPMRSGVAKTFQSLDDAFTCCVGTGMENHASYGEAIYTVSEAEVRVNLFIPSTFADDVRSVRLETRYPEDGRVRVVVEKSVGRWAMKLRRPGWAGDMRVSVNGAAVAGEPGADGYVSVERVGVGGWEAGDVVEAEVGMRVRAEATPDDGGKVALFWGPVLLAGVFGGERPGVAPVLVGEGDSQGARSDGVPGGGTRGGDAASPAFSPPTVVGDVVSRIERAGAGLRFVTKGVGRPGEVTLVPLYEVGAGVHYGVYFDVMTAAGYEARKGEMARAASEAAELEARTIDSVQPGQMQPERDHAFRGEKTSAGEFNGRKFRHATDGGWFEFTFKVPAVHVPPSVVVTYWGGDGNPVWASSERRFAVVVQGRKVADEVLLAAEPGRWFEREYRLPADLGLQGGTMTVRFEAEAGKMAGAVYFVRVVRNER